jgi:hypothetical protein
MSPPCLEFAYVPSQRPNFSELSYITTQKTIGLLCRIIAFRTSHMHGPLPVSISSYSCKVNVVGTMENIYLV